jgi:hypothetical protein
VPVQTERPRLIGAAPAIAHCLQEALSAVYAFRSSAVLQRSWLPAFTTVVQPDLPMLFEQASH